VTLPKTSLMPDPSPLPRNDRRRSQRVMIRIPVRLHIPGQAVISATTVAVNDHGAMVLHNKALPLNTHLTLENTHSGERLACKIVRHPQVTNEGALLPLEFENMIPGFWNIIFPPVDAKISF
jgi:hypothetical protein